MNDLFITVLNMSITATWVILAVLLCWLALRGLPKRFRYPLWSVVGFRLVCPVSFRAIFSVFSLKPFDLEKAQRVNANVLGFVQEPTFTARGGVSFGIPGAEIPLAAIRSTAPTVKSAGAPLFHTLAILWLAGALALILYAAIRFIQLKRSLRTAVKLEKDVYYAEGIPSPFIVGFFRPKIYLPAGTEGACLNYALAHERHHLRRFDHGIKLLAFLLLAAHWFNPFVWLAFYLMTNDMEMSCDEAVLARNSDAKKDYGTALLSFAAQKRFPEPSPLSFCENGVKARIKNVLRFKKTKPVLQALAIVLCLALLAACAANPKPFDPEKVHEMPKGPVQQEQGLNGEDSTGNGSTVTGPDGESRPEWIGTEISEELASFPELPLNTALKYVSESEVKTRGVNRTMKAEDLTALLGEPVKTEVETGYSEGPEGRTETFVEEVYVYEGARFTFIRSYLGEPMYDEVYCAEYTDPNADYPRGIRFGDSLRDVLEKLPREYDYRTGYIYGDPYNKNHSGSATIGFEGDHQTNLTIKISCGYWPMLKIGFNDERKVDSIVIVYNSEGIG